MNVKRKYSAKLFAATFCALLGYLNIAESAFAASSGWNTHYSYNQVTNIAETPDRIAGATRLGLLIVEKADNSIRSLTKINGLSDYFISALAYNPYDNSLLVGYENGNIDILRNGKTDNINTLKIKQLDSDKKIIDFLPLGDIVLVATGFGILELDPEKLEIRSTYYIGNDAADLKVNRLAVDSEYIYAATAAGLKRVAVDSPTRHLYESWEHISATSNEYCDLCKFAGGIVAARGNRGASNILEFILPDGTTQNIATIAGFYRLWCNDEKLLVTANAGIRIYNTSLTQLETYGNPIIAGIQQSAAYRDALISGNGMLWAAHNTLAILCNKELNTWNSYLPEGPASNMTHHVRFAGDKLWVVPGSTTSAWNNAQRAPVISVLGNKGWSILNTANSPLLTGATDLLHITANPKNPDNVFISSWGSGVFEVDASGDAPQVVRHHFTSDNGFQNIFANATRYVRVASTAFDKNNVLWMPNSQVPNGLVAYFQTDDSYKRYSYGAIAYVFTLTHFMQASNGDMWSAVVRQGAQSESGIPVSTVGLFIWNDNGTPKDDRDDYYRSVVPVAYDRDSRNKGHIELWDEEGVVISNKITAIAEDQNGFIWIGTDNGVVVQYRPQSIFTTEKPVFSKIKIARNDGTQTADYLLDGKVITAITVDPANRKWIGTEGSGVYLVSADGSRQIEAFNTTNSPLPSDYINAITIDENTGEVYFATGEGLISFTGNATKGSPTYSNIYAYPNPVRPEYRGRITITGLVAGSTVKISDAAGRIVYETTSVGGQAYWDGRNLWGDEVKSGIYLIFVANEDGSMSGVTKIAVVR